MASRNISDQSQAKRVPQSANFAALLEAVALDPAAINSATAPYVTRDAAARKQKPEAAGNSQPALSLRSQDRPNRAQVVASPPPIQPPAKAQPDTSGKKPPKSLRVSKSKIASPPARHLAAKPLAAKPRDLAPRLKFVETKPSVHAAKNPQPSALPNPFPAALHEDLLATDTVAIYSAAPAMAAGPQTAAPPAATFAAATFAPQAERRSTEHSATQDSATDRLATDRLATDRLATDRQADETWVRWPGPKRKCVTISVRLSPADARMLRRRASESQLSVSDYMRSCVLEADQLRAQVKQALAEMKLQAADSQSTEPQATAIREEPAKPYAPMPPKPRESGFKGWFSGLRGPLTTASAMPGQR